MGHGEARLDQPECERHARGRHGTRSQLHAQLLRIRRRRRSLRCDEVDAVPHATRAAVDLVAHLGWSYGGLRLGVGLGSEAAPVAPVQKRSDMS